MSVYQMSGYDMESELQFIAKLGKHSKQGAEMGRGLLIQRYLHALNKRTRGFNGRALLTDNERSQLRARAAMGLS